jgi:hypothetical protein
VQEIITESIDKRREDVKKLIIRLKGNESGPISLSKLVE